MDTVGTTTARLLIGTGIPSSAASMVSRLGGGHAAMEVMEVPHDAPTVAVLARSPVLALMD